MQQLDPLKEVSAAEKRILLNLSTQEREAAEFNGSAVSYTHLYQHRGDGCDGKGQFETMEKGRERVLEQLGIRESELEDDNPEDEILRGIVEPVSYTHLGRPILGSPPKTP